MRMTAFSKTALANPYVRSGLIVAATALSMAYPAFAQIAKLTTVMGKVKGAPVAIGGVAFTIAILWAGSRWPFNTPNGRKWPISSSAEPGVGVISVHRVVELLVDYADEKYAYCAAASFAYRAERLKALALSVKLRLSPDATRLHPSDAVVVLRAGIMSFRSL